MQLNRTGTPLTREERIKLDQNWEIIEKDFNNVVEVVSDKAYEQVVDSAKLTWQAPVNIYEDIATTYPNPEKGWAVMARQDSADYDPNDPNDYRKAGTVWRFDGTEWEPVQQIDPTMINEVEDRLNTKINTDITNLDQKIDDGLNSVDEQLAESTHYINPVSYGAAGDGLTDDTAIFTQLVTDVGLDNVAIIIPSGKTFLVTDITFPNNIEIFFVKGGFLQTLGTVTFEGDIRSGNYQIFKGDGNFNILNSPYNVAYYPGDSLNAKWDSVKRALEVGENRPYECIFPKPTDLNGAIEVNGSYYWKITGTIAFNDPENSSTIYWHGFGRVVEPVSEVIKFGNIAKTENIYFPYGIKIQGLSNADIGIKVYSCARIRFGGDVYILGCSKPLVLGDLNSPQVIEEFDTEKIIGHTFLNDVVTINGFVYQTSKIDIRQIMGYNALDDINSTIVRIKGNSRDVKIGKVGYKVDSTGSNKRVQTGVLFETTSHGSPRDVSIDSIMGYGFSVSRLLESKDTTSGAAGKMKNIKVGMISDGNETSGYQSVRLAYVDGVTISNLKESHGIRLYNSANNVEFNRKHDFLEDAGATFKMGGVGYEKGGTTSTPTLSKWNLGDIVVNTSDNTLWQKISDSEFKNIV